MDGNPHSGNTAADFGSGCTGSYDAIQQTIPTVAGQPYKLSFWLETNATNRDFQAYWNGALIYDNSANGTGVYTQFTFTVVGTGSDILKFQSYNVPSFDYLDDVVLLESSSGAFQIRHFVNLEAADSFIDITNTGASATLAQSQPVPNAQVNIDGSICVNIYAFAADEQEVSCCSCLVTPNGLWSASVKTALLNSTLTPSFPNEVVVKLISTTPANDGNGTQSCNPAQILQTGQTGQAAGALQIGLLAWGTSAHGFRTVTGPTFKLTETPFLVGTLSPTELARDVQECQFIQILGSGQFGICKGCSNSGLGAAAQ